LIDFKINDGSKMKIKEAPNARSYESELFRWDLELFRQRNTG